MTPERCPICDGRRFETLACDRFFCPRCGFIIRVDEQGELVAFESTQHTRAKYVRRI